MLDSTGEITNLNPVSGVSQVVLPHPFSTDRKITVIPPGRTLLEMVRESGVLERNLKKTAALISGEMVPFEMWDKVRPKNGSTIHIVTFPKGGGGGGGGKSPLRIILTLAVMVAAAYAAFALGPLLAEAMFMGEAMTVLTATQYAIGSAIVGGAVSLAGTMLVNAVAPMPSAVSRDFDTSIASTPISAPTYSITGVQNKMNPYGPIPRVLGRNRVYPLVAARPYSESVGGAQYFRALLLLGYGPIKIEDICIGNTPITAFSGVEIETREGWENDAPITLFTKNIREEPLSVVLTNANGWQVRTTRPSIDEASVDLGCPRGLVIYDGGGTRQQHSVSLEVQYSPHGQNTWTDVTWINSSDSGFETPGKVTITDTSSSPVRRGGNFKFPSTGQYDIRVRRTSADLTDIKYVEATSWQALRSIKYEDPVKMKGLSMIAIRLKATEQLNGMPDQINCIATSYLPTWNGSSWDWTISRNPAWAYLHILRTRGLNTLIPDSRIDIPSFVNWAAACDTVPPNSTGPMWTFDAVIEGGSVFETIKQIAAHARSSFGMRNGKFSIVRDVNQTVPVQHITPRNSWGYKGTKIFSDLPHALKVRWVNPDKNWQEDERIVYDDGYDEDNADKFETVDLMGCKDPQQAWRDGRYYMAVGRLRPETHSLYMDVESIRCTLGDLVKFSHDVIKVGISSGRIKKTVVDETDRVIEYTLDEKVSMDPNKQYSLRCRKSDGDSFVITLTNNEGPTNVVEPITPIPYSLSPKEGDLFQFGESGKESIDCIVKRIAPGPNLTASITLVDAAPGVHTADSGTIPDFVSSITSPYVVGFQNPPEPTILDVVSDESVLERTPSGQVRSRIQITISTDNNSTVTSVADGLQLQWKLSTSTVWQHTSTIPEAPVIYISPVTDGETYDIRVRSVDKFGRTSEWVNTSNTVVGKTSRPINVSNFIATPYVDAIELKWNANPELDVSGYHIKVGNSWDDSEEVTSGFQGTSYTVYVRDANPYTYFIKAIDETGLESESAISVTSSVVSPSIVSRFDAVAHPGDRINLYWDAVPGQDVEYVIRCGPTWGTSQEVAVTKGTNANILYPTSSLSLTFWIKTRSVPGKYSDQVLATTISTVLEQNRNVVYSYDNQGDSWNGITKWMQVDPLTGALVLSGAGTYANPRGEHYFEIDLGGEQTARTWLDSDLVVYDPENFITWEDASFSWDSLEALSSWTPTGDNDGSSLTKLIAIHTGVSGGDGDILSLPLNGGLNSLEGTTPSESVGVTYQSSRVLDGLLVTDNTRVSWDVSCPQVFSMSFELVMDVNTLPNLCELFTLKNTSNGSFIKVTYMNNTLTGDKTLTLSGSDDNAIIIPISFYSQDYGFVGVSQSLTERSIYFRSEVSYNESFQSEAVLPIGTFDKLFLYRV